MNFNSASFLAFVVIVYGVHRAVPARWWGLEKYFLLASSYLFYCWFEPLYVFLLFGSTVVDWFCGRELSISRVALRRRVAVCISVATNLSLLGFFKYADFFLQQGALIWGTSIPSLGFVLPIGISFYTFQSMSYTIDLYRGRIERFGRFSDFALFVSLFPQLVAGPIVRASEFGPQIRRKRPFRWPQFSWGLFLILLGFFHKCVLADNLSSVVDPYFEVADGSQSFVVSWLAIYSFSAQIYCDFAGYSWIAIGLAYLFGWRFPQNFHLPYLATSFSDFWRRWHMTLSRFLRDYLYIPLGGNRTGRSKTVRNLMLTMLLGGLWHGAAWTFVVWGFLHGLFLVVERSTPRLPLPPFLRRLLVFHGVCIAWVFFRSPNLAHAVQILSSLTGNLSVNDFQFHPGYWFLGVTVVLHLSGLFSSSRLPRHRRRRYSFGWYLAASAVMLLAILRLRGESGAFLYFQF